MLRLVLIAVLIYLMIRLLLNSLREKFFSSTDFSAPGASAKESAEETEYEVIESRVKEDP